MDLLFAALLAWSAFIAIDRSTIRLLVTLSRVKGTRKARANTANLRDSGAPTKALLKTESDLWSRKDLSSWPMMRTVLTIKTPAIATGRAPGGILAHTFLLFVSTAVF